MNLAFTMKMLLQGNFSLSLASLCCSSKHFAELYFLIINFFHNLIEKTINVPEKQSSMKCWYEPAMGSRY